MFPTNVLREEYVGRVFLVYRLPAPTNPDPLFSFIQLLSEITSAPDTLAPKSVNHLHT